MIKKIQFLIGFFIIASNLFAQTGTIEGIITDKKTREAVIGASVFTETLKKGVVSDLDGHFVINNLYPGDYDLKVSYVSYETI